MTDATALSLRAMTAQLAAELQQRGWMLATAESCTGGMLAAACTDLPGSSTWFDRGFVTYSNAAKTEMLGVPAALIAAHGAVSQEVAQAMAAGALAHSHAQVSIATTGIAGPGGATAGKPVGAVWIAWKYQEYCQAQLFHFSGSREAVRAQAVHCGLQKITALLTAQ